MASLLERLTASLKRHQVAVGVGIVAIGAAGYGLWQVRLDTPAAACVRRHGARWSLSHADCCAPFMCRVARSC